ncbi:Uncharacterised protein [Pseudomonas aeruginosa]|uniref:hypothetical protein n=1 Tax=Pseudomonas aeruginosa TaxID=287 RepID=UPI000717571E|nr:hypothetical protein [Pseudomonas aeruginosa]KRV02469.1 hypothetical protein AN455_11125 [Pseudomonas aeruginosa]KRV08276.1 hypothetical protein AN456_11955 [Pseudomonas aeruginosa]SQC54700.1 Uncharacterised protein [Pseudomonas aeruginosa]
MNVLGFAALLFVFIGTLASCTAFVALVLLMLRFWPLLLVVTLALVLLHRLLQLLGIRITVEP